MNFPVMRAIACAATLLIVGCGTVPNLMAPKIDEQGANTLMSEGRFREAAEAYQKLAKRDRDARERLQLLSAAAWREEGDFSQVRKSLDTIKRSRLAQEQSLQYDLLDAEILLQAGDADGALNLLVADPKKLPSDLALRYHELRARAFAAKRDYADAANERAVLNSLLDPVERAANEFELKALIAKLQPEDLRNLVRATPRTSPLYTFLMASGAAPRDGAAVSFTDSVTSGPAVKREGSLQNAQRAPLRKIALLLPQTGPAAGAAKAVQDGIFSAYFADDAANKPEILLMDSGITAQSARSAYQQAIAQGADFVIGPLQRDQVTAIFQNEQALVPMLALNFAQAPVLPPQGSLQFALLPEEEAAAVAERMFERGLKRVAVLVPSDDFGKRAAEAFEAKFRNLGGEVLERGSFSATGTDYSSAIKTALGVAESQARTQMVRQTVGIPFTAQASRRYDLEGLFVAARPQQARLLLPQLRSFDAEDWPILATSHVYGGTVDRAKDRDLNGIEFCDAPWILGAVEDGSIPNRAAVGTLTSSYGAGGRLFAYGIDAYRIAPYTGWLEQQTGTGIAGATGTLSVDKSGSIRRVPTCARMQDGAPSVR
jgi:uncharacterized protein